MIQVTVCIGSSCHIHGSHAVVQEMIKLIDENQLNDELELMAGFCMGDCINGVCVTVGDKKLRKVSEENVREIFEKEIKPLVKR